MIKDNQSMHNPTEQNTMKLTPKNVETIFLNCLFTAEEVNELDIATDNSKYIEAKGVTTHVGFHPQRLKDSEKSVCEMLGELSMFFHTRFGGSSFLNMCEDKDGKQWTGMHKIMDQLVCLGVGLNIITVIRPDKNSEVIGSMPIISINLEEN